MKKKRPIRNKWLHFRLSETERHKIHQLWQASTCRELSDYARRVLLQKPVALRYRNESVDELLSVLIGIKNELTAASIHFHQAVHKLHSFDQLPEIRLWLLVHESACETFLKKTEELFFKMNEIYQLWSQK